MLRSDASICECEHSQLLAYLFSARLCRATPFKREKDLLRRKKKAKPEKRPSGAIIWFKRLYGLSGFLFLRLK